MYALTRWLSVALLCVAATLLVAAYPGSDGKTQEPLKESDPFPKEIYEPPTAQMRADAARMESSTRTFTCGTEEDPCIWTPFEEIGYDAIDVAWNSGGDTVWAVTSNNQIWRTTGPLGSWTAVYGGYASRVAAGLTKAWVVATNGNLYERGGAGWVYRGIDDQEAVDVAVGDETNQYVWATDEYGRLWKYDGSTEWDLVTSAVTGGIDASPDGTIWVVAGPYRYLYYKEVGGSWTNAGIYNVEDVGAHYPTDEHYSAWATKSTGIYQLQDGTWEKFEGEIYGSSPPEIMYTADAIHGGRNQGEGYYNYPAIVGDDQNIYRFDAPQ